MAIIPNDSLKGPLAPKVGLSDTRNLEIDTNTGSKRRNYSRLFPVGILVLAVLILPITLQQLGKSQDTREHAAGPAPTLALPTSAVAPPTATPTTSATPSGELGN